MATGTWHKTACNLCYVNCGIEVLVNEGHIEKVRGDRSSPKSQGYLCNKAARIPYYAHQKDRLTPPLRCCGDGGFDAIEWDVAIAESAERVRNLVDRHGGKCMAVYGGGGQGNCAGGAYAGAFVRALGSRNVFNALSQEKTGDFWVNGHMFGSQTCHTSEDVHNCDLLLVIGANPWIAHGFPNARDHLNHIRKDPARKLIVFDPGRSETAQLADLHLAVRPGTDAFLLGALLATLVRSDSIDHDFIGEHTVGFAEVKQALLEIPIREWAAAAEISLADLERCASMIAAAKAMVVRVELGIQQGVNSTLSSYLEKLLIMLSGSFGRKGTNQLRSWLQPLWGSSPSQRFSPTGDEVIAGLAVGAPAVYDKDGHKLRAEVGRNIAAGIFWAKTRYRSAPPSSTMSAAPPGGIKHDVKRIMRDEIPLQQHAHDLSHSRLEPERCEQSAGQASIDANHAFQVLHTSGKAVSFYCCRL